MKPILTRFRLRLSSVRVRLTFWNVCVLALVLIVLGGLLRERVEANLIAGIDQELAGRGRRLRRDWPPQPPPPGMREFFDRQRQQAQASHHGPNDHHSHGDRSDHDDRHKLDARHPASPTVVATTTPAVKQGDTASVVAAPAMAGGSPSPTPSASPDAKNGDRNGPPFRILDLNGRNYFSQEPDTKLDAAAFAESLKPGAKEGYTTIRGENGEPTRVFTVPLHTKDGRTNAIFQVDKSLVPVYDELQRLNKTLLALVPIALFVAALGGAFLTDRALRPVRAVTRAASRTQAADLSARLDVSGSDEFSELAETFNAMLARLESAFTRLENAYEQQRRFVADASHELKTPLTVIKANTSLALSDGEMSAGDYREALEAVDRAVDRTGRIVQDLFLLARSDSDQMPIDRQSISLDRVLESVRDEEQLLHPDAARIEVLPSESLILCADAHLLQRLFGNLVENALRHTPSEGMVTLGARRDGNQVIVEVTDNGEGIAPEHLPNVCERFYRVDAARARTSGTGGGTGLGLPICRAIAEAHGGELSLTSELHRGTTVRVALPL